MKKVTLSLLSTVVILLSSTSSYAEQQALTNFNNNYATNVTDCSLCHAGVPSLNVFGADFRAQGGVKTAYNANFGALDGLDSDGDGTNNGPQIAAGFAPANAAVTLDSLSAPVSQDLATVGGCISGSNSLPIAMLLGLLATTFIRRLGQAK